MQIKKYVEDITDDFKEEYQEIVLDRVLEELYYTYEYDFYADTEVENDKEPIIIRLIEQEKLSIERVYKNVFSNKYDTPSWID